MLLIFGKFPNSTWTALIGRFTAIVYLAAYLSERFQILTQNTSINYQSFAKILANSDQPMAKYRRKKIFYFSVVRLYPPVVGKAQRQASTTSLRQLRNPRTNRVTTPVRWALKIKIKRKVKDTKERNGNVII